MSTKQELTKKTKRFKMLSTPALLMVIIISVAALTYIVPAGEFERVFDETTNRTLVVAGSFHGVEKSPVGLVQLFSALYRGIDNASKIIAFVFIVGGAFGIVTKSGTINAGLGVLIKKLAGRESILIAIVMTAFALGGATFGMAEESLPFVAMLVTISLALGYDSIVGVAMVIIGIYCGYSAGPLNPFNTGIAQGIAELPLFSGMGLRIVLMIGALVIAIHHTISYGKKVKAKGREDLDEETLARIEEQKAQMELEMTSQQKLILAILVAVIGILIFGVLKYKWYLTEIAALFMAMGIIVGLITFKGNFELVANEFVKGAKDLAVAAIFIGLSRAILVVMQDGKILDTLVYGLSIPLANLNSVIASWGMYIAQGFINFFIPSSSGQAVVVMPIMSSLSDLVGIKRQVAVLAYQAGDGYWNMITPTHSTLMASLGLAGLSFSKWFKFALPLVLKWTAWIMIVLSIAVLTNWGPF